MAFRIHDSVARGEIDNRVKGIAGMGDFLEKLTGAIEQQQRGQKHPDEKWNEHDYDKFMKECDARTDKYMELLDFADAPEPTQNAGLDIHLLRFSQ